MADGSQPFCHGSFATDEDVPARANSIDHAPQVRALLALAGHHDPRRRRR